MENPWLGVDYADVRVNEDRERKDQGKDKKKK
jgi:hypothetical protein